MAADGASGPSVLAALAAAADAHANVVHVLGFLHLLAAAGASLAVATAVRGSRPGWRRARALLPCVLYNLLLPSTVWRWQAAALAGRFRGGRFDRFEYSLPSICTTAWLSWMLNSKLLLFAFGAEPYESLMRSRPLAGAGCLFFAVVPERAPPAGAAGRGARGRRQPFAAGTAAYAAAVVLLAASFRALEGDAGDALFGAHKLRALRWIVANGLMSLLAGSYMFNALVARDLMGVAVITPFRNPYTSRSLADFWSARWNILISDLLRGTVYRPAAAALGRTPAAAVVGVLLSFAVSGLMHELMVVHLDPARVGSFMLFFASHGAAVCLEGAASRRAGLGRALASLLGPAAARWASFLCTFAFVYVTTELFFVPAIEGMRLPAYLRRVATDVEAVAAAAVGSSAAGPYGADL